MTARKQKPVLILGGGINGCAAARELVLNGVPVCLVERQDLSWGATSRSSRLIHGGLRYLENGEFRLVRESLEERSRLRKLAPQFVRPFRLHIPVARRLGGLWSSSAKFLSGGRWGKSRHGLRGMWLVRLGLWFYDRFGKDPQFPNSDVVSTKARSAPDVDPSRYRWLCRYADAQMMYPERFVLSMLTDTQQLAEENGVDFQVYTYHEVRPQDPYWEIIDRETSHVTESIEPALIINATGAWGDLTLDRIHVDAPPLFGGTKGSHFLTHQPALCEALGDQGVYAEAEDGRLVFVLPLAGGVWVGTTDERFEGDPDQAVATEPELDYLVEMINELFPQVKLTRDDIEMHCAGVRPLPKADESKTSAISRDHSIHFSEHAGTQILTLVGGKLTTARAFGEVVADEVFSRLEIARTADSRERVFPGGAEYPPSDQLDQRWNELANHFERPVEQIRVMWSLCGTRVRDFLSSLDSPDATPLAGTDFPRDFVRWIIQTEWVRKLDDLIERRLMLVYHPQLSLECVRQLADMLVEAERFTQQEKDEKIAAAVSRLQTIYGKTVGQESASGKLTKSPSH